ncbi:MAG: hypothetical protein GX772_05680 [Alcaligenaceae bacterium]|nr:hypothetical protein [Alcaligenaceae bacterium]
MTTRAYDQVQDTYAISDGLFLKALGWLNRNAGSYLDNNDMFKACVAQLRDQHDISDHTAERIAGRAVAEFESRTIPFYIDIDQSTSSLLALRDGRSGAIHFVGLKRLIEITGLPAARPKTFSTAG